jgi:hypothetical protein
LLTCIELVDVTWIRSDELSTAKLHIHPPAILAPSPTTIPTRFIRKMQFSTPGDPYLVSIAMSFDTNRLSLIVDPNVALKATPV